MLSYVYYSVHFNMPGPRGRAMSQPSRQISIFNAI
jgi:hypothetical protein